MKYKKIKEIKSKSCDGCCFECKPFGCKIPYNLICDASEQVIFVVEKKGMKNEIQKSKRE